MAIRGARKVPELLKVGAISTSERGKVREGVKWVGAQKRGEGEGRQRDS